MSNLKFIFTGAVPIQDTQFRTDLFLKVHYAGLGRYFNQKRKIFIDSFFYFDVTE